MIGRRRPDTREDELPEDLRAGDYWKILDVATGEPLHVETAGNLTGTAWHVACPVATGDGFLLATLKNHTVREEEDGTISVRPGDGSSNSILVTGGPGGSRQWHGYIEHGELTV